MTKAARPSGVRIALGLLGMVALAAALSWWFAQVVWSGWLALRSPAPASAADLLVVTCAALGLVVLLWLVVAILSSAASMRGKPGMS